MENLPPLIRRQKKACGKRILIIPSFRYLGIIKKIHGFPRAVEHLSLIKISNLHEALQKPPWLILQNPPMAFYGPLVANVDHELLKSMVKTESHTDSLRTLTEPSA